MMVMIVLIVINHYTTKSSVFKFSPMISGKMMINATMAMVMMIVGAKKGYCN